MTFSVAGVCPFPFVSGLPRTGIVLVSDTRYSWGRARSPFDYGMKVCSLGSYAGGVCAGVVPDAKNAVRELQRYFSHNARPSLDKAKDAIPSVLAAADERWGSAQGRAPSYAVAVAFVSEQNRTELVVWAPASQLASQPEWGRIIGDRDHDEAYDKRLREIVDANLQTGASISFEPDEWVLPYSMALYDTFIRQERTPSVGGGVQIAIVSPTLGYVEREMLVAPSDGLKDEEPHLDWDRISRDVTWDWRTRRKS